MKNLLKAIFLVGFCLSITAQPSYAQVDFNFDEEEDQGPKVLNPYDDKYKVDIKADASEGTSLVPNYVYYAGFIRKPESSADDLNLQIISPGMIMGCLHMESPSIEPVKIGPALHLKITDGFIAPDNETIRYFHYDCKQSSGTSQMHMTFSKKQLKEDGIEKLVVVTEQLGAFNDVALDMNDQRTILTSKVRDLSHLGLPLTGSEEIFTFWHYPENTMVLLSSATDLRDKNTMRAVKNLARSKGLTPLDEIFTGFTPRYEQSNLLYVVDTQAIYKDKLPTPTDNFLLGAIEQNEQYYGANGPYDKKIKKTIMARKPGLYE